ARCREGGRGPWCRAQDAIPYADPSRRALRVLRLRSRCTQLEPQNRRVASEVRARGVDRRAVARRDGADEEVDGASDDALGATAIEELRGAFIVVGRGRQVRKRAQRGAQALPGLLIANAR